MKLAELRAQVVNYCRRLAQSDLSIGTTGNISAIDQEESLIAISPGAMDYGSMEAADVVLLNLQGEVVDGERRPSSEWAMHLGCYAQRADIGAIVHTHSPAATTLAVLGQELPAVHYMIALSGGGTIPLAPYHTYGTAALAQAAVAAMGAGHACLLQNHGVLAAGPDLAWAWSLAEQVEFCADIYLRASAVGEPEILSQSQIEEVIEQLDAYRAQH
ncbi:MAG: class II aldolase/adducin family protein [Halieaceae bacterium]